MMVNLSIDQERQVNIVNWDIFTFIGNKAIADNKSYIVDLNNM